MPTDDDAYRHLASMLNGLEDAIRLHRDVVFRAISQLNREVIGFQQRLDKDDEARAVRQKEIDIKLDALQRWQWIRIVVEVIAVLIVLHYFGVW